MNGWMNSLIDSSMKCWGCPVFDRLFQVISAAAAALYRQFSLFCILIFCLILAFYILYAVWKNISTGAKDPMYQKYIKPVLINSLFVFALLGMGVALPRFITTITFEPVADITLTYTQSMIKIDSDTVEEKIPYQPEAMSDDGFYRPALRDKIILLMKTTITQFQSYMELGIAIMDEAFSLSALLGIGALIKHILMFFVGLYLLYGFFKIFIKFCFYFVDVIVAMTFFAFFFPLSLAMFAFKNSEAPDWVKKLGGDLGAGQFKSVVNAIVSLASAVLTYTVIIGIIAKFFSDPDADTAELMNKITSGEIFDVALSDDKLEALTIGSCFVLIYVAEFLASQIGEVTKMVMSAFDVQENNKLSEEMGENALKLTGIVLTTVKNAGKTIISGGEKKEEEKKEGEKKEGDKKGEEKKT
ncbi:MAG: hypothetical protein LBD50_02135 [Rickettsiales bacterium]|jgi:hypothetical protein|nr:hypothetical protein [Rickettsiales bacterium]